jgi:hypothetical protein
LLGGAGPEVALGPLAFDVDGGFVALSKFGDGDGNPDWLSFGIARFDAAGATRWSKSFATSGNNLHSEAVAISPLGNVFLGFMNYTRMDLGGGRLPDGRGVVVKLAPDGRFVWQRDFPAFSGLAVDGSGSVLVAAGQRVVKLRRDGERLWEWPVPADFTWELPKVAFDPAGHAIVAIGRDVFKLDAEGAVVWKVSFETNNFLRVQDLGTTARGTVVVAGAFVGGFSYAGTTLEGDPEYDSGAFVAVIEADGRPRWARSRGTYAGPLTIDPGGRLAMLEGDDRHGCNDVLSKWDLTGKELWRRRVATCDGGDFRGAWARGVGVAPSGAIWVQGDASQPFDVGTGTLVPRESDWFLLRVAP